MIKDKLPSALSFGMLPVTTAESPKLTSLQDKTLYEYPIFGAVSLSDGLEWKPIPLSRFGLPAKLLKPKVGQANLVAEGLITSETLDARYTTFVFETDLYPISETSPPDIFRQALAELIHLLRTVARQYWLGLTMANEGFIYQAVRSRIESGIAAFSKSGSYFNPFIIRPLDTQMWRFIGDMLEGGYSPSNGEVILSDALLEIRRGALVNAVMLLGIACEVEITILLEQLADRKSLSNNKRNSMLRETFKVKFLTRMIELGAGDPRSAKLTGFAPDWANTVCDLYTARNRAAHSGTCLVADGGTLKPIDMHQISKLVYAADALLAWTNQERKRLGIPPFLTATMLPGGYPVMAVTAPA